MIRKFFQMLFGIKRKHRLPYIPHMLTNDYDRHVSRDIEKAFIATAARSPEGVKLQMKRHKVNTVDELLAVLPNRSRRAKPRERFKRWIMRNAGTTPYEPVISKALRQMKREGTIPRRGTLIRRTPYQE